MGKLHLIWHGHSCFTLEENGYSIVLDPYDDGYVPGFGPLRLEADQVLCSHGHNDHNAVQCVKINKDAASKKSPFTVTGIHSWHDDAQGKKRGENIIRIFDDGEYRIAHMGDIGFFTMEPGDAKKLVEELQPRMLIPMHYRGAGFGYDIIAPVGNYLSLCDSATIFHAGKSRITLPEDMKAGTLVLDAPVK